MLSNSLETSKHLKEFSDMFSLISLTITATCRKSAPGTAFDIMLTNKPNYFTYTGPVTTGLGDCHKLILSSLGADFMRLPLKQVIYRDCQQFIREYFPRDLNHKMIRTSLYQNEDQYAAFTVVFKYVINKHVPLRKVDIFILLSWPKNLVKQLWLEN